MEKTTIYSSFYDNFARFVLAEPEFKKLPTPLFANFFKNETISGTDFKTIFGKRADVMATVTGVGSKAPLRKDGNLTTIANSNLFITHGKQRGRDEIINIQRLLAEATSTSRKQVLKGLFDDLVFVYNGVISRKSAMVCQLLSSGYVELNNTNNPDGVKDKFLDYNLKAVNKLNRIAAWGNPATAVPLADIKAAKKKNRFLKFMLMTEDTAYQMIAADSMKAATYGIKFADGADASFTNATLTIDKVNAYLTSMRLPTIVLIDDLAQTETNRGEIAAIDTWVTGAVTFVETMDQGDFNHSPSVEMQSPVFAKLADIAEINNVTLVKSGSLDPLFEKVIASTYAGLDWVAADKCVILTTV